MSGGNSEVGNSDLLYSPKQKLRVLRTAVLKTFPATNQGRHRWDWKGKQHLLSGLFWDGISIGLLFQIFLVRNKGVYQNRTKESKA